MLNTEARSIYSSEHAIFRSSVRKFLTQEVDPKFERWELQGCVDREFFKVFGAAGYLCPTVPEQYGGLGASFLYNAILDEELAYYGFWAGTTPQSDILVRYVHFDVMGHYCKSMNLLKLQRARSLAISDGSINRSALRV